MENGNGTENKSGQQNDNNAQNQNNNQTKVEFSPEQQSFIQKMFDTRFGKIEAKHNDAQQALKTENETLKAELEALKTGKSGKKDGENTDPQQKQFADLLNNEKAQTKAAKELAEKRENEAKQMAAENLKIRKEIAINKAAGGRFLDMEAVMAMTDRNIEYDEESKTFVVRENGIIRQNSSLQNMSLEEYFEDFGKKRPYLVRSDVAGGAGSSEAGRNAGISTGVVRTKADLKTVKEKSQYITKFGLDAYEKLPLR